MEDLTSSHHHDGRATVPQSTHSKASALVNDEDLRLPPVGSALNIAEITAYRERARQFRQWSSVAAAGVVVGGRLKN
jgi:hypothetical protein